MDPTELNSLPSSAETAPRERLRCFFGDPEKIEGLANDWLAENPAVQIVQITSAPLHPGSVMLTMHYRR